MKIGLALVDVGVSCSVAHRRGRTIVEAKFGRDEAFNGDDLGDHAVFLKTLVISNLPGPAAPAGDHASWRSSSC